MVPVLVVTGPVGVGKTAVLREIEQRSDLDRLSDAVHGAEVTVDRLRASLPVLEARVRSREPHHRPVGEIAREVLRTAGWPAG